MAYVFNDEQLEIQALVRRVARERVAPRADEIDRTAELLIGSTLSPWVVTLEALAPFRAPAVTRAPGDPAPLPYLSDATNAQAGAIDVRIEVLLRTSRIRARQAAPVRLSHSTLADMYWTPAQLLAHHASTGCALHPGDLLGSGTVSGAAKESRGCLLELTWKGTERVELPTGETRRFLEDGYEGGGSGSDGR